MDKRIVSVQSNAVEVFAPAKINLFLAVTGRRNDGFHDLCTVMSKINLGDHLNLSRTTSGSDVVLHCSGNLTLENNRNLAFLAAEKWLKYSGQSWGVKIDLDKTIPPRSGLGGGSSDAVSVLLGMNELSEKKLSREVLLGLASELGSDCPAFLDAGPCLAQGRGEQISLLGEVAREKLRKKRVFLFRPDIGLSTPEIFADFSRSNSFSDNSWANERVEAWQSGSLNSEQFLHNDLESAVFEKHRYFIPLFEEITAKFGLVPRMSGSGSCCFALLPENFNEMSELEERVRVAWGSGAWVKSTELFL